VPQRPAIQPDSGIAEIAPLADIDRLVLEADAAPDVVARLRKGEHAPEIVLAARSRA
jgi:hypothetical protein